MDVPMKNSFPGFIKRYVPEINGEELIIPSGFINDVKEALPQSVVLNDRHSYSWNVKMEEVGNVWYFKDGWKRFIADHFLELGDTMTFLYYGGGQFFVKTYGLDACEKKRPPNPSVRKETSNACQSSRAPVNPEDNDIIVLDEEDGAENDDGQGQHDMEAGAVANKPRRKKVTDWFGCDLFESGLVQKPKNLYFVTTFRSPGRANEVYIPTLIYEFYDVALPTRIDLVDESGRKFPSRLSIWKDGRRNYCGGWKNFCNLNSVAPDDSCIFEFVGGGDEDLHIRVSVIHANRQ